MNFFVVALFAIVAIVSAYPQGGRTVIEKTIITNGQPGFGGRPGFGGPGVGGPGYGRGPAPLPSYGGRPGGPGGPGFGGPGFGRGPTTTVVKTTVIRG